MVEAVDLTNLRDMTEGDSELEQALFEEFFSSARDCIQTLAVNSLDGVSEQWRSSAHALKGMSYNLGAKVLGDYCKQAQEGYESNASQKQALLQAIQTEYARVVDFLNTVYR